jgi:hypothetical protein
VARAEVVFRNFADGEYGSLDPSLVGFSLYRQRMLYRGYWTGQNVMRALDGSLCPRAGEKPYVLTGVPNGTIAGMGESGGKIWFVVGTTVYSFDSGVFTSQAVTAYTGALPAGLTEPLTNVTYNNKSYVTTYPNGVYELDHTAHTVAAVAGSPSLINCAIYGERMVGGSANTLYFSDPDDFTSWPAANFIQIGESTNITAVRTLRSSLAIGKSNEVWYVLSGVPGVNEVVRQVTSAPTPPHHEMSVDTGLAVGYVADESLTLSMFTGTSVQPLPHLKIESSLPSGIPSQLVAFRLRNPGEWGVVSDNSNDANDTTAGTIWLYRNGAWTKHRRAIVANIEGGWVVTTTKHEWIVMGQGGAVSAPPTFAAWDPYLDRPPFASDTGTTVIDPSLVTFTLPEFVDYSGAEMAVRHVEVEYTKWGTGDSASNTNSFTVTPSCTLIQDGAADVALAAQTWSEDPALASTTGTKGRFTADYAGDTYGQGFKITVSNLRGVSIRRVTVIYDTRPDQTA